MKDNRLALISGWGTTSDVWKDLLGELQPETGILDFNWIDCLDSSSEGYDPFKSLQESDLPVILIGWSLGAIHALKMLSEKELPGVAAFVCISGAAKFTGDKTNPGAEKRELEAMQKLLTRSPEAVLNNFLERALAPERSGDLLTRLNEKAKCFTLESLIQGLEYLNKSDSLASLNIIKTKTLIVHGQEDAIIPIEAGELLQSKLQNSQFSIIEGAGHTLPLTRHKSLAGLIRSFINELYNK